MMLVLPNVTMEPSNVRTKIKELSNVIKVLSNMMLVLLNVTMELSNVRKKKLDDKRTVKYDVGTVKCDEKKGNHQI